MIRTAALLVLVLSLGCTRTHTVRERDGSVSAVDGGVSRDASGRDAGPRVCSEPAPVDILFVVDNSSSMDEEQAALARELEAFVSALLEPPDRDGDGDADWLPVADLQMGVVTTDMGTGGFMVPTCTEPNFGDDGILRTDGNAAIPGCMEAYPPFVTAVPGESDPAVVADSFRCVAQMGIGGCGLEQQLEAMLKAVTPSSSPLRFAMGTVGHADGLNAGFVRDASLLAIIHLTDEEDCSAADPELFDPSSDRFEGSLGTRCYMNPDALHPVDRYVQGLLALRDGAPERLLYSVLAGVPGDITHPPVSYDVMLADERMQHTVDPARPTSILPSCSGPSGNFYPPRRIVEVASALERNGVTTTAQSLCDGELSAEVAEIAAAIGIHACARFLE